MGLILTSESDPRITNETPSHEVTTHRDALRILARSRHYEWWEESSLSPLGSCTRYPVDGPGSRLSRELSSFQRLSSLLKKNQKISNVVNQKYSFNNIFEYKRYQRAQVLCTK